MKTRFFHWISVVAAVVLIGCGDQAPHAGPASTADSTPADTGGSETVTGDGSPTDGTGPDTVGADGQGDGAVGSDAADPDGADQDGGSTDAAEIDTAEVDMAEVDTAGSDVAELDADVDLDVDLDADIPDGTDWPDVDDALDGSADATEATDAADDSADGASDGDTAPGCLSAADCPASVTPCQASVCQEGGVCGFAQAATGTACDDSLGCTTGDICSDQGVCQGAVKPELCDFAASGKSPSCATLTCADSGGPNGGVACLFADVTGTCDDGSACTSGDACSEGACSGASVLCSDANACTNDSCDKTQGCVYSANSLSCSDGSACTVGDACGGGVCMPGQATVCDDANPCTSDSCDKTQGCVYSANSLSCSDGSACTVGDSCGGGVCMPGQATACDDANPCTSDSCDKTQGCVYSANSLSCSDGSACTVGDSCGGGVCMPGQATVCDDANPCTSDSCDKTQGCVYSANSLSCSDGSACTVGDACGGGVCMPGQATVCDDANPCTSDSCDKAVGCVNLNSDVTCTDGSACTIGDSCSSGACLPGQVTSCDDANPCTSDSCDKAMGCVNLNLDVTCTDGSACTIGDSCSSGACLPGQVTSCDDGNVCTLDTCNPSAGCVALAAQATCSDGDGCTAGDACSQGICKAGAAKDCNDGDPCTADSCADGNCAHAAIEGCAMCLDAAFPMAPVVAGSVASTEPVYLAFALTSTAASPPYGLGAKWSGSEGATGTAISTWTAPSVAAAVGTKLRFKLQAVLGDGECGADDVAILVNGAVSKTVCASTNGSESIEIAIGGTEMGQVNVEIRAIAGKGAGNSGFVAIDDVQIYGACTPVDATCGGSCAAGTSCNSKTGACEFHLVLSEIATQGATAGDEFVELYNPGDSAMAIGGTLLQYRSATGTSWSTKVTVTAGTVIKARGYYLLTSATSYASAVAADQKSTGDMSLGGAAGALQLLLGTTTLDQCGYGSPNSNAEGAGPAPAANPTTAASLERKARASSTADSLASGGADELAGNGFDSNHNAIDWVVRSSRGPQNSSSAVEKP